MKQAFSTKSATSSKTVHSSRITVLALLLAFVAISISGCKESTNTTGLKNVSGRPGELVIVMPSEAWKGIAGDTVRALLAQPQLALPQDEPLFNITSIPQEGFGDIFKTSRNLIIIKIAQSVENPEVKFQNNVYANTQAIVTITAKDAMQFVDVFAKNSDKIIGYLLRAERSRLISNYMTYFERSITETISPKFGVKINVAPGFEIVEDRDTFMWVRFETPEISQGLFIYEFPYESDSTFTQNYLMTKRIIAWKNNVPGPRDGSYMTNENELPPVFNILTHNGNYAAETRNLWRVENDYMGGPYISLAVLDMLKQRVIVVEGYVYAPSKKKRNLLRQVEGMIYTLRFDNQADIDKINKQFE
jgi:hypothetical protein